MSYKTHLERSGVPVACARFNPVGVAGPSLKMSERSLFRGLESLSGLDVWLSSGMSSP